jgi:hypothetical protein
MAKYLKNAYDSYHKMSPVHFATFQMEKKPSDIELLFPKENIHLMKTGQNIS